MRIAMATHDRPADVTAESSDVSDRRQRLEGRGLTCQSAPSDTARAASSMQCCVPRNQRIAAQFIGTAYLQASTQSKSSAVAKKVQGSVCTSERAREKLYPTSTRGGLTAGRNGSQWGQHRQEKMIIRVVICVRCRIVVDSLCDSLFIHYVHYSEVNNEPIKCK